MVHPKPDYSIAREVGTTTLKRMERVRDLEAFRVAGAIVRSRRPHPMPWPSRGSERLCELLDRRPFRTPAEGRMEVFRYIEGWYNPPRRQASVGYLSPATFEARNWTAAGEALGGEACLPADPLGLLAGLGSYPLQAAKALDTWWRKQVRNKLIQNAVLSYPLNRGRPTPTS